jgi:hypothetical protein
MFKSCLTAVLAFLCAGVAQAFVTSEEIRVPVKVVDMYGKTAEQEIVVGLFRETRAQPDAVAVLNHGRPPRRWATHVRGTRGRGALVDELRFWRPCRSARGYGASDGPDVEFGGKFCGSRNFPPGFTRRRYKRSPCWRTCASARRGV